MTFDLLPCVILSSVWLAGHICRRRVVFAVDISAVFTLIASSSPVVRWPLIQTPSSDRLCVIQAWLKVNPLKNMTTGTVTLDCWTVSFGTSQIDLVRINDGD